MPAYKDEKSGKWFASFYYKDWDGQSRKKLKRGFETKKEAITYERNFTVKMSGSLNCSLKIILNSIVLML